MEILDRKLLIDNVDGDRELLKEIVDIFFETSDDLLVDIRKAVESGDPDATHKTAHQLKGALGNVGAKVATDTAFQLETMGREERMEQALDAVAKLEQDMEQLKPELQTLVAD